MARQTVQTSKQAVQLAEASRKNDLEARQSVDKQIPYAGRYVKTNEQSW